MEAAIICRVSLLALVVAACGSQGKVERDVESAKTGECLARESLAVAPLSLDLETATLAVLARCDVPGVLERPLIEKYPGYRDYIRSQVARQYADIRETTRQGIALLRARAASSSVSAQGTNR